MPPTKAMGAITQNRHVLPTETPLSTSWYLGVVQFGRARERRQHLIGCIFLAKFSRRGVWYPGRIAMGGPNWTVYPGQKNRSYHNQASEASLCSVNRPWDGTAAMFVATEIRGNIRRLGVVKGMGNWWPGGPFQWLRPLLLYKYTTIKLG